MIVLERRSLIVFCDEAYTNHLHGINNVYEREIVGINHSKYSKQGPITNSDSIDVEPGQFISRNGNIRVSLTFRDVALSS